MGKRHHFDMNSINRCIHVASNGAETNVTRINDSGGTLKWVPGGQGPVTFGMNTTSSSGTSTVTHNLTSWASNNNTYTRAGDSGMCLINFYGNLTANYNSGGGTVTVTAQQVWRVYSGSTVVLEVDGGSVGAGNSGTSGAPASININSTHGFYLGSNEITKITGTLYHIGSTACGVQISSASAVLFP
jgi:hypothetical protein